MSFEVKTMPRRGSMAFTDKSRIFAVAVEGSATVTSVVGIHKSLWIFALQELVYPFSIQSLHSEDLIFVVSQVAWPFL